MRWPRSSRVMLRLCTVVIPVGVSIFMCPFTGPLDAAGKPHLQSELQRNSKGLSSLHLGSQ